MNAQANLPPAIRVLLVEDNSVDAELVLAQLDESGIRPEWRRVEDAASFLAALAAPPDIILADYALPQFSALAALRLLREHEIGVPLIVVSGSIGDEAAAECIREGAVDYLLKDRLKRLGLAVAQALAHRRMQEEHDAAAETVRRERELMRTLIDQIPDPIYVKDRACRFQLANAALGRLVGAAPAEVVGRSDEDFFPAQLAAQFRADEQRVLAGQVLLNQEEAMAAADGTPHILLTSKLPLRDHGGAVTSLIGIGRDITERKQADEVLRRQEELLRDFAETITDVFWSASPDLRTVNYVSPAFERIWGRSAEEMRDAPERFFATIVPEHRAQVIAAAEGLVAGRDYALEYRIQRPDGSQRWILGRGFAVRSAAGVIRRAVGVSQDITERKLADESLRESEERFGKIFRSSPAPMGFGTLDEGRIIDVNERYAAFFGFRREEMIDRRVADLNLWVDPAQRAALVAQLHATKSVRDLECRFQRKCGEVRTALLSVEMIEWHAQPVGIFMLTDVTESKKMEAELLRVQRLESVGRLASGIAHDLNNILAPVLMAAPLLRMRLPPDDVERTLNTIETSAKRGADLVRQLLIFGRGMEAGRGPVPLEPIVRELVAILGETFPKNITIEVALDPELWPARGDRTQLHQVLLNLCVNARDAMPGGGRLGLSARNVQVDDSFAAMHPEAKPGAYVLIRVSDTGVGIPPEIAEKVFDPFFTTKEMGKGTGLGLSTVLGVVRSHGGFLQLKSEVRSGTVFDIYLPAETESRAAPASEAEELPPRGKGERILVADDEENIREVLQQTLEQHNYRVLTATDGAQAIATLSQRLGEIDLVITDLDMPLVDGVTVVKVLLAMRRDARVIVSTGMTSDQRSTERLAELQALGVRSVLPKPYTAAKMLRAVHDLLVAK